MKPLRFAVLGDPVAHTKSPIIHAAAYRALGMPHSYEALHTKGEALFERVQELRTGAFAGFNVTVPHKVAVLQFVDEVAKSAQMAGAANTLVPTASRTIVAHNTDSPALGVELARLAPEYGNAWKDVTALVLGSGGAARSAIVALATELGVREVEVRARAFGDEQKAANFASEMRSLLATTGARAKVCVAPLSPSPEREREVAVVVQATSAGMTGSAPGDSVARAVAWAELPAHAVALDVVYAPPSTPFLEAAAGLGLRTANGFGMLARQGALAFELWLGEKAPFDAMLAALR